MVKDKEYSKHPRDVKGFNGNLEELAQNIGNMQYDCTANFICALADDIRKQANADKNRGRLKLASRLYETSQELYKSSEAMQKVWKICERYMR